MKWAHVVPIVAVLAQLVETSLPLMILKARCVRREALLILRRLLVESNTGSGSCLLCREDIGCVRVRLLKAFPHGLNFKP